MDDTQSAYGALAPNIQRPPTDRGGSHAMRVTVHPLSIILCTILPCAARPLILHPADAARGAWRIFAPKRHAGLPVSLARKGAERRATTTRLLYELAPRR